MWGSNKLAQKTNRRAVWFTCPKRYSRDGDLLPPSACGWHDICSGQDQSWCKRAGYCQRILLVVIQIHLVALKDCAKCEPSQDLLITLFQMIFLQHYTSGSISVLLSGMICHPNSRLSHNLAVVLMLIMINHLALTWGVTEKEVEKTM